MAWWTDISRGGTASTWASRPVRSVYEERFAERESDDGRWVRVADTDPMTGSLEWEDDWGRKVTGWWPLDEFLRRRGL